MAEPLKIDDFLGPPPEPATNRQSIDDFLGPPRDADPRAPDTALSATGKFVRNVPAVLRSQAGGFTQAAGEGRVAEAVLTPLPFLAGTGLREPILQGLRRLTGNEDLARRGEEIAINAQQDLAENAPEFGDNILGQYTYELAMGLTQMIPALAVGAATRSPALGAAVIGGGVYGDQYGRSRAMGRSEAEANQDAMFMAVAEGVPSAVPLGILMKPGKTFMGRTLRAIGAEGVQETMTGLLQEGYAKGVLNEDMTWGEVVQSAFWQGAVGAGVGGALSISTEPLARRGRREEAAEAPPELTPEDQASPIPDDVIAEGKAILQDAEVTQDVDRDVQSLGLPPTGSRVFVTAQDGRTLTGTIVDLVEDRSDGRPADAVALYDDQNPDTQVGWYDPQTGRTFSLDTPPQGTQPGWVRIQVDRIGRTFDIPLTEIEAGRFNVTELSVPPQRDEDDEQRRLGAPGTIYGDGFVSREAGAEPGLIGQAPRPARPALPAPPQPSGATITEGEGFTVRGEDQPQRALPSPFPPGTVAGEGFTTPTPTPRVRRGPQVSRGQPFRPTTPAKPAEVASAADLDAVRAEVDPHPTEGQKEAGNYKHAHVRVQGFDIAIETPRDGIRSGTDRDGNAWRVRMPADYGRFKRTEGADGDQVDVYIGPRPEVGTVYVVDQIEPGDGRFDEHKVMLGFASRADAEAAYDAAFSDGSGPRRRGAVTEMDIEPFRDWLKTSNTKTPLAYQRPQEVPKPTSVFTFLARKGGIRDDEGHNLRGMRGMQRFIPRSGPFIRPSGMSIDEAGDILRDAGYFGPPAIADRPTERQVLDLLEQAAAGEPITQDEQDFADQEAEKAALDQARREVREVAGELGAVLTNSEVETVAAMVTPQMDASDALVEYLEARAIRDEGLTDEASDVQPEEIPFDAPEAGIDRGEARPQGERPQLEPEGEGGGQEARPEPARPQQVASPPEGVTEQTPAGEQTLIPGTQPITDQDRIEAGQNRPLRPDRPQQAADEGLFDLGARDQTDLVDQVRQAERPAENTQPEQDVKPKLFTDERAEAARQRIRDRLRNRLGAGLDPELLLDGIIVAGNHIERGARSWAAYSRAMVEDFGEAIRPFLRSFYEGVRNYPEFDATGMTPAAEIDAILDAGETPQEGAPAALTRASVGDVFRAAFIEGQGFKTITEARKLVGERLGVTVRAGTPEAKLVDEGIEVGVILAAREIAATPDQAPLETYRRLVDLYNRQPNLSTRTSTSVREQAYSTPVPLGFLASRLAGITPTSDVYEPTAGHGALLIEAAPGNVTANELNADRADALRSIMPEADIATEDAANWKPRGRFDVVIGNPPFGAVKGEDGKTIRYQVDDLYETGEVDHAIAMKALETLKDDGSAVLIVGSVAKTARSDDARSDAYNSKAKREFYLRLYEQYNVADHFTVAGELYSRQGAAWPVDVITIRGRGKSARSVPAADVPRQYVSWAALEEVLNERDRSEQAGGAVRRPLSERPGTDAGERPARRDRGDSVPSRADRPARDAVADQDRGADGVRDGPVARQPARPGLGERVARTTDAASQNQQPRPSDGDLAKPAPRLAGGENEGQVTYTPGSAASSMGTLVPVNMQTAVSNALARLQERVGDLDAFVAERLGYPVDALGDSFAAEQIDAIALGIDNMERGAGFIIGDQTGIGKGRVVAAMIRYALRTGRQPVFVTEKPNLYADMFRDMTDIGLPEMLGRDLRLLMTNSSEKVPLDEDGDIVLKSGTKAAHDKVLAAAKPLDYDLILTTYVQMQTVGGNETTRQRFLRRMVEGGVLIMDESHNAGGTKSDDPRAQAAARQAGPSRSDFARELVSLAQGVFYSSATYAKRPEVMDLYSATDMKKAVSDIEQLSEAISRGGVPMQQVVATMLTGAGQYIRRERSFNGIVYNSPVVEVNRKGYEQISLALKQIQTFSDVHMKDAVKNLDRQLKAEGRAISHDGSVGRAGASSTSFSAVMHNLIEQMLLAMKAPIAADLAIEALKRGEKPVITVSNTMGSFIEEYVASLGIAPGQTLPTNFSSLLMRYLERSRVVNLRRPFSKDKGEKIRIDDETLGEAGAAHFRRTKEMIEGLDLGDLPLSPIDMIRHKVRLAGYTVGEITGRNAILNYEGDVARYERRPAKEAKAEGRRKVISDFNAGRTDVMILNQAGSTGLSLHASERFKDQRKRRMIVAQAEKNIDTHMQMLGRVNRTGQVVAPEYDQLVANVPAEKRPAAVLAKKMASLNANTTASRKGALTADDVPDFLNDVGDEVAVRVMSDFPDLYIALGAPLSEGGTGGYVQADAMRKVTGRVPLLPIKQQEEVYALLESEYAAVLEQKEAMGESPLEAKTLALDAKTLLRTQAVAPTQGDSSPFADGVYVEEIDAKRLGRPFSSEQVIQSVAEYGGGKADTFDEAARIAGKAHDAAFDNAKAEFDAYLRQTLDDMGSDETRAAMQSRLMDSRRAFETVWNIARPGKTVKLNTPNAGNFYGVVTNVRRSGKTKNPMAASGWRVTVAVASSARQLTIPFSQIGNGDLQVRIEEATQVFGGMPITEAFDTMQMEQRERRTVLTGNLLAAFEHVNGKGSIVNFTTDTGEVRQGILLPRDYEYAKEQAGKPVKFRNGDEVLRYLEQTAPAGEVRSVDDGVTLVNAPGGLRIDTAAARSRGGKYYLSPRVTRIVGRDFVKSGNVMRAEVPVGKAPEMIETLKDLGAVFQATDNLDIARKIVMGEAGAKALEEASAKPANLAGVGLRGAGGTPEPTRAPTPGRPGPGQGSVRPSRTEPQAQDRGDVTTVVPGFSTAETTHAKKGIKLYVASLSERVERDEYKRLEALAKQHGGYYSSYRKAGAIPGFQFESAEDRQAFLDEAKGTAKFSIREFTRSIGGWSVVFEQSEAFKAQRAEVFADLRRRMDALGLKDVGLRIADSIRAVGQDGAEAQADGMYAARVIAVALDAENPARAFNHEAIHAMRALGLFNKTQWSILESRAAGWRRRFDIDTRYQDLDEAGRNEEAIAEAFAEYVVSQESQGLVARVMDKVLNALRAIASAFRGHGFNTAEDVFRAADAGTIGQAERIGPEADAAPKFSFRIPSPMGRNAFEPHLSTLEWLSADAVGLMDRLKGAASREAVAEQIDRWRTVLQDRFIPLRRLQETVSRQLGEPLSESQNPYLAEELMAGRVGAKLERLTEDMLHPLFAEMQKRGVSQEELETYLYARHAPERNARISEINPSFEEGTGSGMTDAEAAAVMEAIEASGKLEDLKALAERVDGILGFALRTRVQAGLLSLEEAQAWRATYRHYVPLRGEAEMDPELENIRPRRGSGINVRGKESQRAFGRVTPARDILAYTLLQAEEAIIRAETNRVAQRFHALAEAMPDENFWKIDKVTRKPVFSKATGTVHYVDTPLVQPEDRDFTVSVKIEGVQHNITLNRRNPAARRLAESMRNLSGERIGAVTELFMHVNRYLSNVNTTLNPEFIITNAFRDIQTAIVNLGEFDVKGLIAGTVKDYPKALAGALRGAFNRKADGEWVKWYNEFVEAGGRVYFNRIENIGEIRGRIEREVRDAKPGPSTLKAIRTLFETIEKTNIGVENAVRLAAYKNARQRGMTVEQAASLAKNLTVNFNRRGTWGAAINAYYLFYNASIQGSFRIFQAMKSPRVQKVLGGIVAAGALVELMNVLVSEEDEDGELWYDKISEFEKSRNLIIMIPEGGGKYIKVPLPYGYNVFYAIGRSGVELTRGRKPTETLAALASTFVDSFNPIGGAQSLLNFLAPTVVDPAVDLALNRDFANRAIMPEQNPYAPAEPQSQQYWSSVNPIWKTVTDTLNRMTGGDDVTPGAVDVSPEVLEYLGSFVTGAAGDFYIKRLGGLVGKIADPNVDVELNDVPFARRLIGKRPTWYDRNAFYERAREIESLEARIDRYAETGRRDQARALLEDHRDLLSLRRAAKTTREGLANIRRRRALLAEARADGRVEPAAQRTQLDELEARERALLTRFNAAYVERVLRDD